MYIQTYEGDFVDMNQIFTITPSKVKENGTTVYRIMAYHNNGIDKSTIFKHKKLRYRDLIYSRLKDAIVSTNTTSTPYVTVDYTEVPNTPCTNISVAVMKPNLTVGEYTAMTVKLSPVDTNDDYSIAISDNTVATIQPMQIGQVKNYAIVGLKQGNTQITVSCGDISKVFNIHVD